MRAKKVILMSFLDYNFFFGGIGEIMTKFRYKYIYRKSKQLNGHVLIIKVNSYVSSCGGIAQLVFIKWLCV